MLKVSQKNTIPFNNLTKNINYQLLIENHSRRSGEKKGRYRRSDSENERILNNNNELSQIIVSKKDISEKKKIIVDLLKKGADVNFKDGNRKDNTPLHLAVKRGELEIVNFLLTQGADSSIQNKENKTSLEIAEGLKRNDIVDAINRHRQQTVQQQPVINQPGELEINGESDGHKLPFPRNFLKGNAVGEGDCFFDSLAQGMNQLNLGQSFDVKSLRQACFDDIYNSKTDNLYRQAIVNDAVIGGYAIGNRDETADFNSYLHRIGLTAKDKNELEILGLTQPILGRPEIEGRLLCKKYGIKLHLIEKHIIDGQEVITHQLVDNSGSRSTDEHVSLYSDPKVVHILNEGHAHFVPILHKSSASNKQIEKQARSSPPQ